MQGTDTSALQQSCATMHQSLSAQVIGQTLLGDKLPSEPLSNQLNLVA